MYIKLTLYLTLHCIGFHPEGVYRFNLLGLEIAAILPRLVVTAMSDGLVIFMFFREFLFLINKP